MNAQPKFLKLQMNTDSFPRLRVNPWFSRFGVGSGRLRKSVVAHSRESRRLAFDQRLSAL